MEFDKELDTRGMNCPMPILRTKKSLSEISPGQILKIWASDPSAPKDFEVFAIQSGHELLASAKEGNEFVFFLKKKPD